MLRFAANLTMWWKTLPFPERFEKAAQAGFKAVEFMSPFAFDLDEVAQAQKETGLFVVQFNFADADIAAGDRGFLSHPQRMGEWRDEFFQALDFAKRVRPRQLNSLVGNRLEGVSIDEQVRCAEDNLHWALPYLERAGLPLNLEALNPLDNPGYWLTTSGQTVELLQRIHSPWLRFQCDVYHMQRTEGNLVETMRKHIHWINHVQVADCPGRHQPGTGEINYNFVFRTLEELGYDGYVGLEYVPLGTPEEALSWLPVAARMQCKTADLKL